MTVSRGCLYEVKFIVASAGQATGQLKVDSAVLTTDYSQTMVYADARK